jgi:hypothetical protein
MKASYRNGLTTKEHNVSIDWNKSKLVRQQARREQFSKMSGAGASTRVAQTWDTRIQNKRKLTVHNASAEAIQTVRDIMNNMQFPGSLKLSYAGIRRTARGWDQTEIKDGVITVHGQFRTQTGNHVYFDVPVEIRNGELLDPSVFIHEGNVKVIAQSSFSEIAKDHTTYEDRPIRGIYSPPLSKQESNARAIHVETHRPGIFESHASKEILRRAIQLKGRNIDVTEVKAGMPDWVKKKFVDGDEDKKDGPSRKEAFLWEPAGGRHIDPARDNHKDDFLDPAERDRSQYFKVGEIVSVDKELMAVDRGGVRQSIPKGMAGRILRDIAGDGKQFYIQFKNGLKAVVQNYYLKASQATVEKSASFLAQAADKAATLSDADIIQQIQKEIKSLEESGIPPQDIDIAIHRRYPAYADKVLGGGNMDVEATPEPGGEPEVPEWAIEQAYQQWEHMIGGDEQAAMQQFRPQYAGQTWEVYKNGWISDTISDILEGAAMDYPDSDDR